MRNSPALTFATCQQVTVGVWLSPPPDLDQALKGGAFDTRQLAGEQIFFAFTSGNQDGHRFVSQLVGSEVSLLVVEKPMGLLKGVAVLQVDDSLKALHQIARWRAQTFAGKLVALTGSSGKTTTKNWLVHFLSSTYKTQANPGSFNNQIGCPVTLLALDLDTEVLVLEMGTSGAGELDLLGSVAPADVTLLLNVGHAHMGNFGSRQRLVEAKFEVFKHQRQGAVSLLPARGDWGAVTLPNRRLTFGAQGDYGFERLAINGVQGTQKIRLTGPGFTLVVEANHLGPFVAETLCAIKAVCDQLGGLNPPFASLTSSLPSIRGRSWLLPGPNGSRLIDDSYNANPESVVSLCQTLAAYPAEVRVACIGNLAEMDPQLNQSLSVITEGLPQELTHLFLCGETASLLQSELQKTHPNLNIQGFKNPLGMAESVLALAGPDTVIGVKGSRTAHMERLVLWLEQKSVSCSLLSCPLLLNCADCPKLG